MVICLVDCAKLRSCFSYLLPFSIENLTRHKHAQKLLQTFLQPKKKIKTNYREEIHFHIDWIFGCALLVSLFVQTGRVRREKNFSSQINRKPLMKWWWVQRQYQHTAPGEIYIICITIIVFFCSFSFRLMYLLLLLPLSNNNRQQSSYVDQTSSIAVEEKRRGAGVINIHTTVRGTSCEAFFFFEAKQKCQLYPLLLQKLISHILSQI